MTHFNVYGQKANSSPRNNKHIFLSWVFCFECGGVDWNDWAVNRPTTIDDENVFQSDLYAAGVIEVSLKMWL